MFIKVCGLKFQENMEQIAALKPDLIGFIFHPKSRRFIVQKPDLSKLTNSIKKVGVFVNASLEEVQEKVEEYKLDYVQLHGGESPEFCGALKAENAGIIKAFSIEKREDLQSVNPYENVCNFALLDTKTKLFGGSGRSFDWEVLQAYTSSLPFMLSGGLGLHNIEEALGIKHDKLTGFDLNSQLEIEPGQKSIEKTTKIIQKIREYERN